MSDVPYQIQPQIDQLQQERANAVAYGQTDRVAACDKQLASLGVKQEAAEKRASAGASPDARQEPPKDRRSKESTQVTAAPGVDESPKGNASREEWAAYAKTKGASDEETRPVEEGGSSRDDLRAKYGATEKSEA